MTGGTAPVGARRVFGLSSNRQGSGGHAVHAVAWCTGQLGGGWSYSRSWETVLLSAALGA